MKTKIYLIIIFIIFTSACVTQKQLGTKTSASKYNPISHVLHPKYKVFHESEESTKLYLKLFTKELRFSSANKERINQAVIKVNYKITETIRGTHIIDSAQTIIRIKKTAGQTSLISFFKLKKIVSDQYFIEINLTDVYGNKKSQSYIRVNNSKDDNSQYYLSLIKKNMKPEFEEYFRISDSIIIRHKKLSSKKMYISYYKNNFKPADKPFSSTDRQSFRLEKDSSWVIPAEFNRAEFYASKPGIYIIRADSLKLKGILKVNFKNSYPLITRSDNLIETLQYLLKKSEYEKMKKSENKKLSVDNFWIKITGNSERAKELLKIWYNRATYSNYYFTSYKEGWKTDRGMIYMVLGPPDDIQHFDDAEKWIYRNNKEDKSIELIFIQQLNSISVNDFTLMRENKYEPVWSNAIKSWRSGAVYHY